MDKDILLEKLLVQFIIKRYPLINVTSFSILKYIEDGINNYYSCAYDYWLNGVFYRYGSIAIFEKDIILETRTLKILKIKQKICLK